jgi:hypothetical protein
MHSVRQRHVDDEGVRHANNESVRHANGDLVRRATGDLFKDGNDKSVPAFLLRLTKESMMRMPAILDCQNCELKPRKMGFKHARTANSESLAGNASTAFRQGRYQQPRERMAEHASH